MKTRRIAAESEMQAAKQIRTKGCLRRCFQVVVAPFDGTNCVMCININQASYIPLEVSTLTTDDRIGVDGWTDGASDIWKAGRQVRWMSSKPAMRL